MTAILDFHKVMRALTTPFTIPTPSENQLIIIANHKSVGVARHNLFWRSWGGGGGGGGGGGNLPTLLYAVRT